jgi:hypothetical protein
MATTINGVSRYAGTDLLTSFVGAPNHPDLLPIFFDGATGNISTTVSAPCSGYFYGATVTATTSSANNTLLVVVTNESNADVELMNITFDDAPVISVNTPYTIARGSSYVSNAAVCKVTLGQTIKLATTEANTMAIEGITLYFEAAS